MLDDAQRRTLMAEAALARQSGQHDRAVSLLHDLLRTAPSHGPAWNMLGLIALDQARAPEAVRHLQQAAQIDPKAPPVWFNLARAQRLLGDRAGELTSLDRALGLDAYFLPALLAKGELLCATGREVEAVELYRLLFEGLGDTSGFPPAVQAQLGEARRLLDEHGEGKWRLYSDAIAAVADEHPDADLSRAEIYALNRAGKRKIYLNQPTGGHFPFLPAHEYFPRDLFPWFEALEQHTAAIRDELVALWAAEDPNFRPYVAYAPGTPVGEWKELNHSPRWSAWFLWENGVRQEENCRRCPKTAAVLDALPMLDIPGKGPTAMFSVLQPRTRIPPHTGSTNARCTIHLPLIVPPGCGFRVGGDTREWREGEAWAFDDTIEHEAWNNSDQVRTILIIDGWNPLLTKAEKELVRRVG